MLLFLEDKSVLIKIGFIANLVLSLTPVVVDSQNLITPDDSLSPSNSQVVRQNNVIEIITGGTRQGQNLFHSFKEFNIGEGRAVYFYSPNQNIGNILVRVTGTSPSEILGKLGTYGLSKPNLFLMNPQGIYFGPHASLDVGGSFIATTANAILLGDRGNFSASDPKSSNLLDVDPSAFFFNAINAQAAIVNRSASSVGLQVFRGQSLLLVGGEIKLEQGGKLTSAGGRVELGGLAEPGIVELNWTHPDFSLIFPENTPKNAVLITENAEVNVKGKRGGNIAINAQNIEISRGSSLISGIGVDGGGEGGLISLQATDSIVFVEGSGISGNVEVGVLGDASEINVSASSLDLSDNSFFQASNNGEGNGGKVSINVEYGLSLKNSSFIFTDAINTAGSSGNIDINAQSLLLDNNATLGSSNNEGGGSGDIAIQASESVKLERNSTIAAFSMGNPSNIAIETQELRVLNGSGIFLSVFGEQKGGTLTINASDAVEIRGSVKTELGEVGSLISLDTLGDGDGGNVTINTRKLELREGGQISSAAFQGKGNGGLILINALDAVEISGTTPNGLNASRMETDTGDQGNAGNIHIKTGTLNIKDGARISSSTFSSGQGGTITIDANEVAVQGVEALRGFPSSINTITAGTGTAGNIEITTGQLQVTQGASIDVSTLGTAQAGLIDIIASESIALGATPPVTAIFLGSQLTSQTGGTGNGGDIRVSTPKLTVSDRAQITAGTEIASTGKGGNVEIQAATTTLNQGGQIAANSLGMGAAGNIDLQTTSLQLDQGLINAASLNGEGGNITLKISERLTMDNQSLISGRSGTEAAGGGNGGNLEINAPFIVAFPSDSDMIANAFAGQGGNITITTQGIFGIEPRKATPDNGTNDLDASSQLGIQGVITINRPDIDPTQGLVNLPEEFVDVSNLITQGCQARDRATGQFFITGRGGLAPGPEEPLTSAAVILKKDLISPQTGDHQPSDHQQDLPSPQALVPATGWILNEKGYVTLISDHSSTIPTPNSSGNCHDQSPY